MIARSVLVSVVLSGLAVTVQAEDTSEWIWRVGLHSAQPKSGNHELVDVGEATALTFNGTYLWNEHWGVEVLSALPFSHDIVLSSGDKVAETRQLPPTFTLQYHFGQYGWARPYVGAGLNYTVFFDEETTEPLAGGSLQLDPSFGLALQAGVDFDIRKGWFINIDARWIDIDTSASLDGVDLGTVEIDPYALGISGGRRF